MAKVYLPGLDETVRFGFRQKYRDDGYVTNMINHMFKLASEFRESSAYFDWKEINSSVGLCYRYPTKPDLANFRKVAVIFYKPQESELSDVFCRAHEETHALDFLGLDKVVERKFKKNGFNLELSWFDEETKAHLGAFISTLERGLWKIEEIADFENTHLAKRILSLIAPYQSYRSIYC